MGLLLGRMLLGRTAVVCLWGALPGLWLPARLVPSWGTRLLAALAEPKADWAGEWRQIPAWEWSENFPPHILAAVVVQAMSINDPQTSLRRSVRQTEGLAPPKHRTSHSLFYLCRASGLHSQWKLRSDCSDTATWEGTGNLERSKVEWAERGEINGKDCASSLCRMTPESGHGAGTLQRVETCHVD